MNTKAMNTFVSRMTPGITKMIRADHAYVLALFHRYKADTPPDKKRALVTSACLALQVHAQLEEEIFYPALAAVIGGDDMLSKSEAEHNEMRRMIGELRAATNGGAGDPGYDEGFFELMRAVIHHVADEETRVLPAAERLLRDDLGRLGMEMTKRRVELMKPHAGEFVSTTMRSFPGAAAGAALLTAGAVAIGAILLSRRKGAGEGWRRRL